MNNALKRELALITGVAGGIAAILMPRLSQSHSRSRYGLPALLALTSSALYFSSLKKNFDLKEKSVLITGGSRGLGLSLAWNLLARGARITLVARDRQELIDAVEILRADFLTADVEFTVCDVTDSTQLRAALDEVIARKGGLDLMVNNAGAILVGPLTTMERADFEAQMNLHVYAVIDATQHLIPHFKKRGGGRILNICSLGGKVAVPHMIPYDVSKFALAGFSQGAAAELAPYGIYVTTAYPTVMRTGSPIQAVFKGDHQREFEWFAALDNMPLLSMSADKAAKKILNAVVDGQSEIVLSIPGRVRMIVADVFPELANGLMVLATRLLPKGRSKRRKTGVDSEGRFNRNVLMEPLRAKAEKNETLYNQKPHHDAAAALGLPSHLTKPTHH